MGLDALFTPRSLAVYGASAKDSRKLGNTLLRNAASFPGRVVAVNPTAAEVEGVPAVTALDGAVDLALISVPAPAVPQAVEDAARAGCGAAVVLSSGFGETGPEGKAVEAALRSTAQEAGMRLVGPNCMGVVSFLDDGMLNGSYFWSLPQEAGPISFVSQSGAFGGMFFADIQHRGLGIARFLSVGNATDVTETDVLEWLADDRATQVVGVFAEGIRDGRRFVDAARRVTTHKPLVVLKAGKGVAGARAAASHTGSLAGSHAAAQAAFARAGIVEALDSDSLFDTLAALAAGSRHAQRQPAVAVLTISGGPGVLVSDAAERLGLALPPPSPATIQRLRPLLPPFAALGNPFDLTPQCPSDSYVAAMGAVFDDDAYDGVVTINCGLDIPEFGLGIAEGVRRTGKPACAFVIDDPHISGILAHAGVPNFASPERAMAGLAARLR